MFKKFMIISLCFVIGIFFSTMSFSQDEPSTTEEDKVEDVKDDTESEESTEETSDKTQISTTAKIYSDGITTFINSKVLFKLNSTDNIAVDKIEYKIDDGETSVYDKPFSIEKEGNHIIKYFGIDKSGNKETEKAYTVIVDNSGPVVTVTTNKPVKKIGEKIYYSQDILFIINVNDALSGINKIEYSINGTDFQDYIAPFNIISKGEINLMVKASDNVNNITDKFAFNIIDESGKEVEMKETSIKLTTDNVLPIVEIKPDKELKQINNKNVASTDIKYTVTAKDDESGSGIASILYRIDGKGDFIPYKTEIQFLTNGKHKIEAKALDKAGNISNLVGFSVYVDIIPPKTEIETID